MDLEWVGTVVPDNGSPISGGWAEITRTFKGFRGGFLG